MHLRIIILEDTPSEFMQTKHALEQYADLYHHTFEIVWVQNESSLIRMYHAQSFDLLFADIEIKLPNASSSENGIIICKKLRELQYSGDIIFLTNFQEYVFDGYSVRAFNYLLKPITLEVLTPCMDAYLQLHSDDYYYYQNDQTYIRIPYTNIINNDPASKSDAAWTYGKSHPRYCPSESPDTDSQRHHLESVHL